MVTENIKIKMSQTAEVILGTAAVISAFLAMVSAVNFYYNYLYKPTVEVISIDWEKGEAVILVNGKTKINIYGDSTFLLGSDWGITFGRNYTNSGQTKLITLELTRKGMVYEYLKNV